MISATLHIINGDGYTVNKMCFGFMSDINCFHEYTLDDDYNDEDIYIWDDNLNDWVLDPNATEVVVYGGSIKTEDLEKLVFHSNAFESMSVGFTKDQEDVILAAVKEAISGLPQYYDNVTHISDNFTFPLVGVNMQKTIVGAMMIRNILHYGNTAMAFNKMLEMNVEPKLAFILAQRYTYCLGNMGRDWVFYPTQGGDEAIFCDNSKLCDIAGMYNGKFGFIYQGVWGDTRDGYGRYGSYGSNTAIVNPRTNRPSNLTATTMVIDGNSDSQNLCVLENEISGGNNYLNQDQFQALVNHYVAEIKSTTVTTKES